MRSERHWPEYAMEAALLGIFMVSACACTVLLEHPASFAHAAIDDAFTRRALIGLAMGVTAVALIYSPWGRRSGAHFNPAVTISFVQMGAVLVLANGRHARATGLVAGLLVATWITFEAPFSGMSMNPARTLGSAVLANLWSGFWIYSTAPVLGMLAAAEAYVRVRGRHRVYCAKLVHGDGTLRCIFRCNYGALAGASATAAHPAATTRTVA
jgi:glycerol uptake facilitator-like aquaporin